MFFFFFFFLFQFSDVSYHIGNHPQGDLATFGYRIAMKLEFN
jgi:hypothetical protein